jgi:hypothetical protein
MRARPVIGTVERQRVIQMHQKGRELPRREVIALTTEQQRGRTVGWLLHVVQPGRLVPGHRDDRFVMAKRERHGLERVQPECLHL